MIKVKTLVSFIDLQEGITRTKDKDIFEVSEERADELIKKGLVELVDKKEKEVVVCVNEEADKLTEEEKKPVLKKAKKTKSK